MATDCAAVTVGKASHVLHGMLGGGRRLWHPPTSQTGAGASLLPISLALDGLRVRIRDWNGDRNLQKASSMSIMLIEPFCQCKQLPGSRWAGLASVAVQGWGRMTTGAEQ